MRARRALLYMPGDDLHKVSKAATLGVDCACLDMEDGVALNRKAEARQVIVDALQTLDFGRSERLVRINAIGSGLETDDLGALFGERAPTNPARPDGIVVPKVESPEQVHWVNDWLAQAEQRHGWAPGSLALIIQIETALRNLVENAHVHGGTHVRALAWRRDGAAGVDVMDDGPGISEANLPWVFDRFFTTGRAKGCAGLGLALVRAIAQGHGGDVEVRSRPGETCFRIRLAAIHDGRRHPSTPIAT